MIRNFELEKKPEICIKVLQIILIQFWYQIDQLGFTVGPPAITHRALEMAENYCSRTESARKIFFRSFTKTKIPFCRICRDAFYISIRFLCSLNSFLVKNLKHSTYCHPKWSKISFFQNINRYYSVNFWRNRLFLI